jgi:4-hydroxyacetophenone monooxygenase
MSTPAGTKIRKVKMDGDEVRHETTPAFDDRMAREALGIANLNSLRLALYQATGDPSLETMETAQLPLRGGALFQTVLAEKHREEVTEKAIDFLRASIDQPWAPPPSRAESIRLMQLFLSEPWPESKLRLGYEELAFEDFPRDVSWSSSSSADHRDCFVVVIGAGLSGIAAAVQLKRLGIRFVVVDRQAGIGGTWFLNHYPDARVDVGSHLFQFTFEKRHPWTEFFASAGETQAYLDTIVDKHGVRAEMRLGTEVTQALWNDSKNMWQLTLVGANDAEQHLEANFVISASGLFSTPNAVPDIDGIEAYKGRMFHTTGWDHDYDLQGKRVAIIGNGSSGAQLMPAIARTAGSLTVYQRNPQWIGPMTNYRAPVPEALHWLMENFPYYWNWSRLADVVAGLTFQDLHAFDPEWQKTGGTISPRNDSFRAALTEYVSNELQDKPELLGKVLPTFPPMVRRLVVDNGWYKALLRDNVELVTEPIDHFVETGIVTNDGRLREFDLVVMASGFKVSKYLWPVEWIGRDGATLEAVWNKDGARAYLGMVMPRFPNLFMFYGPNGQARAISIYSWAECWARYAVQSIVSLIESGRSTMEVREDVFDDYNARLDGATTKLIWEMEGRSYYVNEHGRSGVNMPWEAQDYHSMIFAPNLDDYELS